MNTLFFKRNFYYVAVFAALILSACNKDLSRSTSSSTTSTTSATSATIAVAVDSVSGDSIYVKQECPRGFFRDSISASSVPSNISTYLNSNYAGFSFTKAFVIKDSTGTIAGYVLIVQYNGKPVALFFSAGGSFVQVLEQTESGDNEHGWHTGGRYGNRNGLQGDTVALSALPSAIGSYFSSNYPNDTLLRAYKNIDSSYLVISTDSIVYASVFTSTGVFVKRVALTNNSSMFNGDIKSVAQDSLPAIAVAYLNTTYPNYVFDKAFSVTRNGTLQGYVVVIDANSTKYAVLFDASGNYVAVRIIW